MFTVTLPYDIGTFMKVKNKDGTVAYKGTVSCYTVTENSYLLWVSGYKEAITGECLLEDVEPMTDEEIYSLKIEYDG